MPIIIFFALGAVIRFQLGQGLGPTMSEPRANYVRAMGQLVQSLGQLASKINYCLVCSIKSEWPKVAISVPSMLKYTTTEVNITIAAQ